MRMHTLRRVQVLPYPLERVFEFFRSPGNLSRITPPGMGFRIITPQPVIMKEGALIDYTIRLLGIPLHWTTMITAYDPPHLFVDQQIRGPYSFWHHTHSFREVDGGTEMTDTVCYVLPGWVLGDIVHAILVKRQLKGIFDYREKVIPSVFSGAGLQESAP